jgi:transcription elongation factor Elf1
MVENKTWEGTCPVCKSKMKVELRASAISATVRCKNCDSSVGLPGWTVVYNPAWDKETN